MKCLACDIILTDFEATRKYKSTGEYVELCDSCIEGAEYEVIIRKDLLKTKSVPTDLDDDKLVETF